MNISGPAAVAKPEMLFYAPGDLTVTFNLIKYDTNTDRVNLAISRIDSALAYEGDDMPYSALAEIKKVFPEV